jgi:hypothetical protein
MRTLAHTAPALLAAGAALLLMAGCATGPASNPSAAVEAPADRGLVYLYRKGSMMGAATPWKIYANGTRITSLANASYSTYLAEPGTVVFAKQMAVTPLNFGLVSLLDPKQELLTLSVEPGQVYYLKFKLGFGKVSLEPVDAPTARSDMAKLSRLD